jgi:hypothetical protein
MSAPIPLCQDFEASQLRGLARRSKDGLIPSIPEIHRDLQIDIMEMKARLAAYPRPPPEFLGTPIPGLPVSLISRAEDCLLRFRRER